MARKLVIPAFAAFLIAAVVFAVVLAAEQGGGAAAGGMGGGGGRGMGMGMGQGGQMTEQEMTQRGQEAMKSMNMSKGMMMRHRMMMDAVVGDYEPNGLVALKDELKLTPDQVSKLQAINQKAEDDAKAVLTADQVKQVDELKGTPNTVAGMHKEMAGKWAEGGQRAMSCPMMGGMMGRGRTGGGMGGNMGGGATGGGNAPATGAGQ